MLYLRNARLAAGVFFLALLAACATPQTTALLSAFPPDLPDRVELDHVVFYPQKEHQCGPASLAMALQHAGKDVQPEQLEPLLYLPDKQGSLQVEMLAAARRHGVPAYVLEPRLQDLLREVAAGNPVLVLQNLGLSWHPIWHYAVVIGYDTRREEVILRSGTEQRQVLPFMTFENTWARGSHWAMVVLPAGRIPETANADAYIKSLVSLEHTNPGEDLFAAYNAAMLRWPENLTAKLTAGNAAYKSGRLHQAKAIFLQATVLHQESVAAFNNLAQTLSDLGEYEEAVLAARQAVSMGGELNTVARQTLAEIEQRVDAK